MGDFSEDQIKILLAILKDDINIAVYHFEEATETKIESIVPVFSPPVTPCSTANNRLGWQPNIKQEDPPEEQQLYDLLSDPKQPNFYQKVLDWHNKYKKYP